MNLDFSPEEIAFRDEVRAFIRDNYPKYVVTMDDFPAITTFKGIKHIHLLDFLSLDDL